MPEDQEAKASEPETDSAPEAPSTTATEVESVADEPLEVVRSGEKVAGVAGTGSLAAAVTMAMIGGFGRSPARRRPRAGPYCRNGARCSRLSPTVS